MLEQSNESHEDGPDQLVAISVTIGTVHAASVKGARPRTWALMRFGVVLHECPGWEKIPRAEARRKEHLYGSRIVR